MKMIHFIIYVVCVAFILTASNRTINEWQYWAIVITIFILGLNIMARMLEE
jgi:hypothetical protein